LIELSRTGLMKGLEAAAAEASLLVLGDPGAGKTWLLQNFVERRTNGGDAVVFLYAEDYGATSIKELEKSLEISNLVDALRSYSGKQRYLVIDSLDSLRVEQTQRVFRDLIRLVHRELPDWRIVASMRTFDARQSTDFHALFPARMPIGFESASIPARNLLVPALSNEELDDAIRQDPRLKFVFDGASEDLQIVLRNPFNLWLVLHLLDENVEIDWLSKVQSEIQLLERYWLHRLENKSDSEARKALLTSLTETMVDSKVLSVSSHHIATVIKPTDAVIRGLQSDDLLRRSVTGRLAFAHNILFDFAVAKLLLDEERLLPFLEADPLRSIFFRPSCSYLLASVWFYEPALFWKTITPLLTVGESLAVRIPVIPARVIQDLANDSSDLEPMFKLGKDEKITAILFLLRALQARNGLGSHKHRLWIWFLAKVTDELHLRFVNETIALLEIASRTTELEADQVVVAESALKLLRWMWIEADGDMTPSNAYSLTSLAAGRVLPLIANYYGLIPISARAAFSEILDRVGKPTASSNETYCLTTNINNVIAYDPAFSVEIYERVFSYEETSEDTTPMGGSGPVMSFTSTRAQDYSMSYYILDQKYPRLLKRDLVLAVKAAALAITAEVTREEGETIQKLGLYKTSFTYLGVQVIFESDRSEIWDQSHRTSHALQLLSRFLNHVREMLPREELTRKQVEDALRELARESKYAVVWKHLLHFGWVHDEVLPFCIELLQTPIILAALETTVDAGNAIKKIFASEKYDTAARQAIETAILAIPQSELSSIYKDATVIRNRLLGCIPEELLGPEARSIVEKARAAEGIPENRPMFSIGSVRTGSFSNDDWLRDQGVKPEEPDNQRLLEHARQISSFESEFMNTVPSLERCYEVEESLRELWNEIQNPASADERVLAQAVTASAAVAKAIVRNESLPKDSSLSALCRVALERAAEHPFPVPPDDADDTFNSVWGPTPKIEAAQGLMDLAWTQGLDVSLRELLTQLAADKSPAVRYQIVSRAANFHAQDREFYWKFVDGRLEAEKSPAVFSALIRSVVFPNVALAEPDRVVDRLAGPLQQWLPSKKTKDIVRDSIDCLTQLYVFLDNEKAHEVLASYLGDPRHSADQLNQIAFSSAYFLLQGLPEGTSNDSAIRRRARATILDVLKATDSAILEILDVLRTPGLAEKEAWQQTLQSLLHVFETVAFRLYLNLDISPDLRREDTKILSDDTRSVVFDEVLPLFSSLCEQSRPQRRRPIAATTTHHIVQTFSLVVAYRPEVVLDLTASLLTGMTLGYEFDSMAIGEVVKLTEIVLADHKDILSKAENAANLGTVLDVFLSAGWPEATRLVMRLENAVR
jgi:KaiC/GvpD/RAD55 family RecA-like ATPase